MGGRTPVKSWDVDALLGPDQAGAIASHPPFELCGEGCRRGHGGHKRCVHYRDGSLKLNHVASVRNKLVGGDTPGPAGCW